MLYWGKKKVFWALSLGLLNACSGTDNGAETEAATAGGTSNAGSSPVSAGKSARSGGSPGTSPSSTGGASSGGESSANGGTTASPSSGQGSVPAGTATGGQSTVTSSSTAVGGSTVTSSSTAMGGRINSTSTTVNPDDGKLFRSRKLDLLLMIDNSLSMGDKQAVLAKAVPPLLRRLTNPDCVSADGTQRQSPAGGPSVGCPTGMAREFNSISDVHIGVVTSSLGDFGGNVCPELGESSDQGFADQNDHGWLLGALPRVGSTSAYLTWSPQDSADFANSIDRKTTEFRSFIASVHEIGCGVEMSLEAWYRFLIDPKPPLDVGQQNQQMVTRGPVDQQILAQRASFLRPDSLVAILMVTDENDCSLKDTGAYSWLTTTMSGTIGMWRGSSACATDPNSPCCYSCMNDLTQQQQVPASCPADPGCTFNGMAGKVQTADPTAPNYDTLGLRCFDQKRRFGFDFLTPVTRYSNALSQRNLCPDQSYGDLDCNCTEAKARGVACTPGTPVPNPLYMNLSGAPVTGVARGNASGVFFATITGVPWQDLATTASQSHATAPLAYKPAAELNWDLFSPPRDNSRAPLDPLMVESVNPRTGVHPITGEALAGVDSSRNANAINGHEWNTQGTDLQFACVFDLETSGTDVSVRNCVEAEYCASASNALECARAFQSCSCRSAGNSPYTANSPLCQGSNGLYSTLQTRAKAYPGVRQLQALRAFHEANALSPNNAIAASLCPKDLAAAHEGSAGYGYNPAVDALLTQLSPHVIP